VIIAIPRPWAPEDAWGALSDGSIATIHSSVPAGVSWSNGSEIELGLTGRAIGCRDREAFYRAWLDSEAHDGDTEQLASIMPIRRIEWPEQTSPFSGREAHADGVGRLWLRITGPEADRTEYVVFDRSSARLRVRLPSGGRVVGFGDGRVWVAVTDDLGRVYLGAHPLP